MKPAKLNMSRCFPGYRWLVLALLLIAVIVACLAIVFGHSDPMKSLRQCERQRLNDSWILTGLQSSLGSCERQAARQHENILELEKRVKELEQMNHNLTIKQQQLDDEIKKCQEQSARCYREEQLMNNKLNTAGEELRQCRLDRDGCQKLSGQASRVHGIHTGLIALSIAFLKLLC
ncbi:hypothetical protein chiPu_0021162 [Chiloscyllium punctatum]|uniref:Uncharacterized protein n=1 Tax=Chiloscyllium punctatum TaxID=137246 RepID=A0A401RNT5_CHIPU|nr:hypothetical protein [Chiloscyllium punctatum]